jgi:hypothetical protein
MATIQGTSDKRRQSANVSVDTTLTLADCGVVQNVIADGKVITLPATTAGACFTIRNGGVPVTSGPAGTGSNKSVLVAISPNASDKIQGNGISASDNKDLLNTKATSSVGDEVTLIGDGTDGWLISNVVGTWVREG